MRLWEKKHLDYQETYLDLMRQNIYKIIKQLLIINYFGGDIT